MHTFKYLITYTNQLQAPFLKTIWKLNYTVRFHTGEYRVVNMQAERERARAYA